jgi:hypothetical protein
MSSGESIESLAHSLSEASTNLPRDEAAAAHQHLTDAATLLGTLGTSGEVVELTDKTQAAADEASQLPETIDQTKTHIANYLGMLTGTADTSTSAPSGSAPEKPAVEVRKSDVESRLPHYNRVADAVKLIKNNKGLEHVSEPIRNLLENMVPVGVDEQGFVVFPESYDPQKGPAILMLDDGQEARIKATDAMVRNAESISEKAGIPVANMDPSLFDSTVSLTEGGAHVHSAVITLQKGDGTKECEVLNPLLIAFSTSVLDIADPRRLGETLAHEVDHWDFNMNELPRLQHESPQTYPANELVAISEKRAYGTSHAVLSDINYYPKNGDMEAVVARHQGITTDQFEQLGNDLVQEYGYPPKELNAAIAVAGIAKVYGKPGQHITPEEIELLKRFGLIHASHQ